MALREQKRFIARQAVGRLLVILSMVFLLTVLFTNLPPNFWSASGLVVWSAAVVGAIALSVMRLIRADNHLIH